MYLSPQRFVTNLSVQFARASFSDQILALSEVRLFTRRKRLERTVIKQELTFFKSERGCFRFHRPGLVSL